MPVAPPCDQVIIPAQALAVRFKVEGEQTDNEVVAPIIGAIGFAFISRETAELASLIQLLTEQVAEIE